MVLQRVRYLEHPHFHFQAIEGHFGRFQFSSVIDKAVRRSKKAKEHSLKKLPVEFYDTVVAEHERNRRVICDASFSKPLEEWASHLLE